MDNVITTKDLYDQLISLPYLHSTPQYTDNHIIWHLWEDFYLRAFSEYGDTYICIETDNIFKRKWCTHWHPSDEDMLETLYEIGKKGNVLVLKSLLGVNTASFGPPDKFSRHRWWHTLYLKQK